MPLYESKKFAENTIAVDEACRAALTIGSEAVLQTILDRVARRDDPRRPLRVACDGWYGLDWPAILERLGQKAADAGLTLDVRPVAGIFKSREAIADYTRAFTETADPGFGVVNTDGHIADLMDAAKVAALRADLDTIPVEQRPAEAKVGYGYFLYQTESTDSGRTWSAPVQLSLWGHPPYLLRLKSGNILLVYGYRRPPWEIRAVLSRDEGRTWDMTTLRTVHTFDPGSYDMGYPVATQLADGSIVCAFYGYSTADVGEKMPHGIFVSVFDEAWMVMQKNRK